jgi:phosphoribosylformimino-5-aminoimidazole carboxamide ribotide isomerase
MIIFPAIDLKDQQVVRLIQGDFNQLTVFDTDPVGVAKAYQTAGATWLHVIDLDGAKTGKRENLNVIKEIVKETDLKVQVGGGIRSIEDVKTLLECGVYRVILGTFAIERMAELKDLTSRYPNQIIVSVDALNGLVQTRGWQQNSNVDVLSFCQQLEASGINTIVYTDISKDGMMAGPNFEDYNTLITKTNLNVIASGGVSTIDDVNRLNDMNLYGCIIGKALYQKTIDLKEAILCSQNESSRV